MLQDSGVPVRHVAGDRAFYNLNRDEIVLPERGQFPSANHYYQTALHELGHSTGHPERMNRDTLTQGIGDGFGSPAYAKEELRREISAMMTGERVGVGHDPSRGAAYVEGGGRGARRSSARDPPSRGRRAEDLRLRPRPEPRSTGRALAGGRGRHPRSRPAARRKAGAPAAGPGTELRPQPLSPRTEP